MHKFIDNIVAFSLKNKFLFEFWKIFITTLLASSSEDKVKMR